MSCGELSLVGGRLTSKPRFKNVKVPELIRGFARDQCLAEPGADGAIVYPSLVGQLGAVERLFEIGAPAVGEPASHRDTKAAFLSCGHLRADATRGKFAQDRLEASALEADRVGQLS